LALHFSVRGILWISFFANFFAAQISAVTFEALLKEGGARRKKQKNFQEHLQREKRDITFALPK
jgi:hypothetical protein